MNHFNVFETVYTNTNFFPVLTVLTFKKCLNRFLALISESSNFQARRPSLGNNFGDQWSIFGGSLNFDPVSMD